MSERSTILRYAATVLVGQLAVTAFGVTDTIVAGRHAEASLAALSIGSAIFISVYVALMGMLQALMPVWAEQRGAQNPARIGASFRQALYVCMAASLLGMWILLSPQALLEWTDVPPVAGVRVADSVGAGDSFMSGLVSGLLDAGLLGSRAAAEALRRADLAAVLPAVERATRCAAITVSREGANPPTRSELGH